MSCRQVFGLADVDLAIRLLAPLPGRNSQCVDRALVSAYRCGAVPDLHRIPEPPRNRPKWQPTRHNISGSPWPVNPIICG